MQNIRRETFRLQRSVQTQHLRNQASEKDDFPQARSSDTRPVRAGCPPLDDHVVFLLSHFRVGSCSRFWPIASRRTLVRPLSIRFSTPPSPVQWQTLRHRSCPVCLHIYRVYYPLAPVFLVGIDTTAILPSCCTRFPLPLATSTNYASAPRRP